MTSRRRTVALAALPLGLAIITACSSSNGDGGTPSPSSTPSPSPTTAAAATAASGPQAFLADVATAGFGDKDASDPAFVSIGNMACQGLSDGVSYGQQVQAFVESDAKPTEAQAETLVRSAVKNLCPEQNGMLP